MPKSFPTHHAMVTLAKFTEYVVIILRQRFTGNLFLQGLEMVKTTSLTWEIRVGGKEFVLKFRMKRQRIVDYTFDISCDDVIFDGEEFSGTYEDASKFILFFIYDALGIDDPKDLKTVLSFLRANESSDRKSRSQFN